jgi:uncharacterized coiled-coil DUF342 family protein
VDARSRWSDDRLDDQAGEFRSFRSEVREEFRGVREEFLDVRQEIRDLRREVREGQRWLMGLQVTTLLGLVAVAVQVATH